ncbi:MAG: M48 family metalloprotease [Candidatus Aenigmarchaeota archaeon]|nr:M48 family metalloprotease [Candidatus Aenigmarchaeota archaeon]
MGYRLVAFSILLLSLISATGSILGFMLRGLSGIFYGFVLSFLLSLLTILLLYRYSPLIILKTYHAKPLKDDKVKELNEILKPLCLNAGINKLPEIYIVPMDNPNAFSTGWGRDKAIICVTAGLLTMDREEIRSVFSHEIWHIRNKDILIQSVAAVVSKILASTIILMPFAVLFTHLSLSPVREYRADYYGVRYAKDSKKLAETVKKMNEIAIEFPLDGFACMSCLWIVNPYTRTGINAWFNTHPPTARRVKRIKDMEHKGMPEPPVLTEIDLD